MAFEAILNRLVGEVARSGSRSLVRRSKLPTPDFKADGLG